MLSCLKPYAPAKRVGDHFDEVQPQALSGIARDLGKYQGFFILRDWRAIIGAGEYRAFGRLPESHIHASVLCVCVLGRIVHDIEKYLHRKRLYHRDRGCVSHIGK